MAKQKSNNIYNGEADAGAVCSIFRSGATRLLDVKTVNEYSIAFNRRTQIIISVETPK